MVMIIWSESGNLVWNENGPFRHSSRDSYVLKIKISINKTHKTAWECGKKTFLAQNGPLKSFI